MSVSGRSLALEEDTNLRVLEAETVSSWLRPTDRVLHLFSGSGEMTIELAKMCARITGIEPSSSLMNSASALLARRRSAAGNINFDRLDPANLPRSLRGQFDVAVSIYGLSHLATADEQQRTIQSLHSLLPDGGRLILIEISSEGLERLNQLRDTYELTPFNVEGMPLGARVVKETLSELFEEEATRDLSTYFIASRVMKPLAVLPDEPKPGDVSDKVARLLLAHTLPTTVASPILCQVFRKK